MKEKTHSPREELKWEKVETDAVIGNYFWCLKGQTYEITIQARPHYCDRGNWLAQLWPAGESIREIDQQDGWPRYFFDLDRAKAECEAFIHKRNLK